jgi:NADH-quinone oxidoreductase subunit E
VIYKTDDYGAPMSDQINQPTLLDILNQFPKANRCDLIPILQRVQESQNYLSKDSMIEIGKFLKLPLSKVYGVATFYNQFKFHAPGKYQIQICRGTACHVEGSSTILAALTNELKINPGETATNGMFSLEVVACIGACGLAPVMSINGEFYAKLTPEKIKTILSDIKNKESNNEL